MGKQIRTMAIPAVLKRVENKLDILLSAVSELQSKVDKFSNEFYEMSEDEDDMVSSTSSEGESECEIISDSDSDASDVSDVSDNERIVATNKPSMVHSWMVPSLTNSKTKYKVKLNDGVWSCTCPSFYYRKSNDFECKHIRDIKQNEL